MFAIVEENIDERVTHLARSLELVAMMPITVSSETIRRRLAENQLKPWLKKMRCISAVGADFIARMEDVLAYCLDRRIPTLAILTREVKAWVRARNPEKARIKWRFTVEKARQKLDRAYLLVRPQVANRTAA